MMSKDEFTRLFTYLAERFDKVDKTLEHTASKADLQRAWDFLDEMVKRQEISDDERLVMGHQLERLNRWTHQLAERIGYKLSI